MRLLSPVPSCLPSNHTVSVEEINCLRYMRYCSDYYNLGCAGPHSCRGPLLGRRPGSSIGSASVLYF